MITKSRTHFILIHCTSLCTQHHLRPNGTMAHYLAPNLANEIVNPIDKHRNRQRLQQAQRAETLVKDDDLWKELQQELAKAKVVSRAAVQEITRDFMQRHEAEIDAQSKIQAMAKKSRDISPRRSSNEIDYHSSLSSLSFIAAKGKSMRRAFSMGLGKHEQEISKDNSSFSKRIASSVNKLSTESTCPKLPVQDRFVPACMRSKAHTDIFDVLEQVESITHQLPDLGDSSMSSSMSSSMYTSKTYSHFMSESLSKQQWEDVDDQSCDDSDDELLVHFPSQPRHQRNQEQLQENVRNSVARSA
jgi:hypothetical protein